MDKQYEFRNARFVGEDAISLEWNHPELGWIPFTAVKEDSEAYGREIFSQAAPTAEPFAPPPPPQQEVPETISDRQFFHVLAVDGLITEAEALAAVKTGDAPAAFETFISSLPEGERFNARMLLEGATTFRRDHPLTNAFGAMHGLTPEEIDDLWRRAAAL